MQTVGLIIAAGLLLGIAGLIAINPPKRKSKGKIYRDKLLDKTQIREKWEGAEQTFALGGPSHFKSAIMEADKLVDFAMIHAGVRGNSMGERLKNAKGKFSDYNDYQNLWFAHKVRNSIAHDITHEVNSAEAKRAMEYFRKSLKILGAI